MAAPILEVTDLSVTFRTGDAEVSAVRGISYSLAPGEVLGIVGESGSGKSASSLAVMGLLPPSAHVEGSVRLDGAEMTGLGDRELSRLRGARISMVFQDPLSALTPVYTIGQQIAEGIRVHNDISKEAANRRVVELLEIVGIPEAARRASAYPHEFSGGMRQRVMIAMAIANDPDVIVADEPTTALDVTIQAQVLEALRTAREATGAAMVLITHDLSVVAGFADRVAVMYGGPDRRDRHRGRGLLPAAHALHDGPARGDPADRRRRRRPARADRRRAALADRPAARLPVRPALPARPRHLPRGRAGAAARSPATSRPATASSTSRSTASRPPTSSRSR